MTTDTANDADCSGTDRADAGSFDRYAAIGTGGEELLLYDEDCEDAWIQSDTWTARPALD